MTDKNVFGTQEWAKYKEGVINSVNKGLFALVK